MAGSFQTDRDIFANPIWKNIVEFRLFFLIFGNAVFSNEGVRMSDDLTLKRGEWVRSTRKLQEDLQYIENRQVKTYSTSVINRCIKKLERMQRICTRTHELGTVFTVVNYDQYQSFTAFKNTNLEHNLEQRWNNSGTVLEQQRNNNKNDNKDKNDNKNNSSSGIGEIDPLFGQAYEMMQQHFHFMNGIQQDEISRYLDNGLKLEVLQEAINKTKLGGKDMNYLFGILRKCEEQGIKTLDQYKEREAQHQREKEFKQQRQQRSSYNKPAKPVIPVVKNEPAPQMSPEEIEKAFELARKLDAEREKRDKRQAI